jgi:hypothetical protein
MNPDNIDDIDDKDCIDLCKALNRIPGIMTTESCCGHGKTEYHIFLQAKSLEGLAPIAFFLDS